MLPSNDRGRRVADPTASSVISDGKSNVAPATDPHCCAALTLDERMTAARFAIHCGVDRCARTVLRGDDR